MYHDRSITRLDKYLYYGLSLIIHIIESVQTVGTLSFFNITDQICPPSGTRWHWWIYILDSRTVKIHFRNFVSIRIHGYIIPRYANALISRYSIHLGVIDCPSHRWCTLTSVSCHQPEFAESEVLCWKLGWKATCSGNRTWRGTKLGWLLEEISIAPSSNHTLSLELSQNPTCLSP